jgi:hypothetical protein
MTVETDAPISDPLNSVALGYRFPAPPSIQDGIQTGLVLPVSNHFIDLPNSRLRASRTSAPSSLWPCSAEDK